MLYSLLLLLVVAARSSYVPGDPGQPWTREEMLVVRAKLWRLFSSGQANLLLREGTPASPGPNIEPYTTFETVTMAPKVLRHGFHDCLRYQDGAGGCDGCMNRKGIGAKFVGNNNDFEYPDITEGDSNGLEAASDILEAIYTKAEFPTKTPTLERSLREGGKSRADLWAFAAITAVDFGIMVNNRLCNNITSDWYDGCTLRDQEPDCLVSKPRGWAFLTGRRDCTEPGVSEERPYWHDRAEVHPNPHGGGAATLHFFKDSFDLTARETVAIMGAHTYGRMNVRHTLFRYGWTSYNMPLFNNHYYRAMVGQPQWYVPQPDCDRIGDAQGRLPPTEWRLKAERDCEGGGPVQWIMFQASCPDCDPSSPVFGGDNCCKDVPQGQHCQDTHNCVKPRFVSGHDLTMLNADMGLYREFETADDWRPVGCPGLEQFNITGWSRKYKLLSRHKLHPHFMANMTSNEQPAARKAVYPLCLVTKEEPAPNVPVVARLCKDQIGENVEWSEIAETGEIVLAGWPGLRLCADHVPDEDHVDVGIRLRNASFQACLWSYDARFGRLVLPGKDGKGDWCLGITDPKFQQNSFEDFPLSMVPCDPVHDGNTFGVYDSDYAGANEFQWAAPSCPLQEASDSPGDQPTHLIVEEFAQYQDYWIGEFMSSLEKVLSNGYSSGELTTGPSLEGATCTLPEDGTGDWTCAM